MNTFKNINRLRQRLSNGNKKRLDSLLKFFHGKIPICAKASVFFRQLLSWLRLRNFQKADIIFLHRVMLFIKNNNSNIKSIENSKIFSILEYKCFGRTFAISLILATEIYLYYTNRFFAIQLFGRKMSLQNFLISFAKNCFVRKIKIVSLSDQSFFDTLMSFINNLSVSRKGLLDLIGSLKNVGINIKGGMNMINSYRKKTDNCPEIEVQRLNKFLDDMEDGIAIPWFKLGFQPAKDPTAIVQSALSDCTLKHIRLHVSSVWEQCIKRLKMKNPKFSSKQDFYAGLISKEDIRNSPYCKITHYFRFSMSYYLGWYATQDFCDKETYEHFKEILQTGLPNPKIKVKNHKIKVSLMPIELVLREQVMLSRVNEDTKPKAKVAFRLGSLQRIRDKEKVKLQWGQIPIEKNRVKRYPDKTFDLQIADSKGDYGNTPQEAPLIGLPATADALDELLIWHEDNGYKNPPDNAYVISKTKGWSKKPHCKQWFWDTLCSGKKPGKKSPEYKSQIYKKYKRVASGHDFCYSWADIVDRLMKNYGERRKFIRHQGRWGVGKLVGKLDTMEKCYLSPRELKVCRKAMLDCIGFPWTVEGCKKWMIEKGINIETGEFSEMIQEVGNTNESDNKQVGGSENKLVDATKALILLVKAKNSNIDMYVKKGMNKQRGEQQKLLNLAKIEEHEKKLEQMIGGI